MTLDEALECARSLDKYSDLRNGIALAEWVTNTLGEAQPCGYETPTVGQVFGVGDSIITVPDWQGVCSPSDARAMAAMLLRAADAAEKAEEK